MVKKWSFRSSRKRMILLGEKFRFGVVNRVYLLTSIHEIEGARATACESATRRNLKPKPKKTFSESTFDRS